MLHHASATYSTPPLFSSPTMLPFSAPVRSASGASWMPADPTNHWELGILITTSRRNWSIPRLSVFLWSLPNQKGGAKALCTTLTTAQNHATTYKSCNIFFQTSNRDCGCAFRIAISWGLDMSWWKSTARTVYWKKSDLRLEHLTILQGHDLLVPSPDESVVPGGGVRNSHVQVCRAPQWESASRSVAENKDENILYV